MNWNNQDLMLLIYDLASFNCYTEALTNIYICFIMEHIWTNQPCHYICWSRLSYNISLSHHIVILKNQAKEKDMNRFHLSLFVFILICTTSTRISGIRVGQQFSNPATRDEHVIVSTARVSRFTKEENVFRPNLEAPIAAGSSESEKRKVPTGSNPLHNKRW